MDCGESEMPDEEVSEGEPSRISAGPPAHGTRLADAGLARNRPSKRARLGAGDDDARKRRRTDGARYPDRGSDGEDDANDELYAVGPPMGPPPPRGNGGNSCTRGLKPRGFKYEKNVCPAVQTTGIAERFIAALSNASVLSEDLQQNFEAIAGQSSSFDYTDDSGQGQSDVLSHDQKADSLQILALFRSIKSSETSSAATAMKWMLDHIYFFLKVQRWDPFSTALSKLKLTLTPA